jgi:hypothetical protein
MNNFVQYIYSTLCFLILACPAKDAHKGAYYDRYYNKIIVPTSFTNKEEALKSGCIPHRLKSRLQESCVIEERSKNRFGFARRVDREVILNIYDMNIQGQFHKSAEIRVPSWYHRAIIKYADLLGDGREFIIATFEGASGTGLSQRLIAILGWNNGRIAPGLIEMLDFHDWVVPSNKKQNLTVFDVFLDSGTPEVSIKLSYEFKAKFPRSNTSKELSWTNKLRWNPKNFSFYSQEVETERMSNPVNIIEKSIASVRLRFLDLKLSNIERESLRKLEIYNFAVEWF